MYQFYFILAVEFDMKKNVGKDVLIFLLPFRLSAHIGQFNR